MDFALISNDGWCAIKTNQTKPNQTHYLCKIELLEIELFDYVTVYKQIIDV